MSSLAAENDVQVQYSDDALHFSKPVAHLQAKLLGACDNAKVDDGTSGLLHPYVLRLSNNMQEYYIMRIYTTELPDTIFFGNL